MWWLVAPTARLRYDGTMASVRSGRWTVSDSVPTLVLPPKCATTSIISYLNNCTSGLVSPNQMLCLNATCEGTVRTYNGDIIHRHVVPRHDQRIYAVIRHPVTRFISFVRYRLSGKHDRYDFVQAGLSIDANVSQLIDSMPDQSMRAFSPFHTLATYLGGAATIILCSLDDFAMHVQQHYNFTRCPSVFTHEIPHGVSYPRDSPREDQLIRISRVFHDDMRLWERSCKGRDIW